MKVQVGDVLRMISRNVSSEPFAFSDCFVVKIEGSVVYLRRPYVLTSGEVGAENFTVFDSSIDSLSWRKVER